MCKPRAFLCLFLAAPTAFAFGAYQPPVDGVELELENHTKEKYLLAHFYAGADMCNQAQSVGEVQDSLLTRVKAGQLVTLSLRGRRADISDPAAWASAGFEVATHTQGSADRILRSYKTPILPSQGVCHKLDAAQRATLGVKEGT